MLWKESLKIIPAAQGDEARVLLKVCFGNQSSLTSSVDSQKKEFLQTQKLGTLFVSHSKSYLHQLKKSDLQMSLSDVFTFLAK
jgi:hypothetical protein